MPTKIEDMISAVRLGMKWLDRNKKGWDKKINLRKLDLGDGNVCITGQLYGDFWDEFIKKDEMTEADSIRHGFYLLSDEGENMSRGYDALTSIWFYELLARRAKCKI